MRTHYLDPLPPDHLAFYHFDNAIHAYSQVPPDQRRSSNYFYKRYDNQRYRLIQTLRRLHASESHIAEWLESLSQQCAVTSFHRNS